MSKATATSGQPGRDNCIPLLRIFIPVSLVFSCLLLSDTSTDSIASQLGQQNYAKITARWDARSWPELIVSGCDTLIRAGRRLQSNHEKTEQHKTGRFP